MWPFLVAMEGGRCFISSTVRLCQVVKWLSLMSWSKVFLAGLKRATWYHLDSYGLLLCDRALCASGCCLLGGWLVFLVMLTCHMPDVVDQFISSTVSPYLTKFR